MDNHPKYKIQHICVYIIYIVLQRENISREQNLCRTYGSCMVQPTGIQYVVPVILIHPCTIFFSHYN